MEDWVDISTALVRVFGSCSRLNIMVTIVRVRFEPGSSGTACSRVDIVFCEVTVASEPDGLQSAGRHTQL